MRKRIIPAGQQETDSHDQQWLDLEAMAEVEMSSEDPAHPIEQALLPGRGSSAWRAAEPGQQKIRILFSQPQRIRRILLEFEEPVAQRTQEYVLRWSSGGGQSYQEIVRQQWNFSPQGATAEKEDHEVDLSEVKVLELIIIPDTSGGSAIASLAKLRLA